MDDTVGPAEDAEDEIEETTWITAGEQDREPGDHDQDEGGQPEEEQHDVVRDCEEPFHERQPAIEVLFCVGVGVVERDALVFVGGRVAVVHQREIDADPVREPEQLEVPVEPPAWVLLPEQDHQERR
jgi:hypothetical protein